MQPLDFDEWMGKYGIDEFEYEAYPDIDQPEWFEEHYEIYLSECQDRAYEEYKDEQLGI